MVSQFERGSERPSALLGLMRTLRCIAAFMLWLDLVPFASGSTASDRDRLLKVDLTELPRFRAVLTSKLGPTRFDCGRVVFEPAFSPEYSVSVYSRESVDKRQQYFATYVVAEDSLNERTEIGRHAWKGNAVKSHRLDCQIPQRTAELVRRAWIGMLSGNQSPRPMRQEDLRTTDATGAEFSIQLSQGKALYGEVLAIELPPGEKTAMLVGLANTLIDYCKAKAKERPAIAAKIDRTANQLLTQLKSEG